MSDWRAQSNESARVKLLNDVDQSKALGNRHVADLCIGMVVIGCDGVLYCMQVVILP